MEFIFKADELGILFATLFASMFVLVGIAASEYMEHEGGSKRFYAFFIPTGVALVLV